jgi:antitoxin FitA
MVCMHDASMPSITVRDVPAETRDELAARAAASGRSLQEYLRAELVELARRPDSATLLERVRRRKAGTGSLLDAATILELKDADRR